MRLSAGLLVYRVRLHELEVLLAHPGGPFFARKDEGAWTIPKGQPHKGEALLEAARREFTEETGFTVDGDFILLAPITQKGGKVVHAWAVEGSFDPAALKSNTFELEWPPHSNKWRSFPEVDRIEFFTVRQALEKIKPTQAPLVLELVSRLSIG